MEDPIYTRILATLLVPGVEYFIRCPNDREPDIGVFGKLSYKPDGSIEEKDLSMLFDDVYSTHEHSFAKPIQLDQIHPSSDLTFWYIFSESKGPYAALAKAQENT